MTIPLTQLKPFLLWLEGQGHSIKTIDTPTLEKYYNEYQNLKIIHQE